MSLASLNILVVEDTPFVAAMTVKALQRKGFNPVHASSGEAALDYLREHRPDLILLDLNVNGISGWMILKFARMLHKDRRIPVIITSAYDDDSNRAIADDHQVDAYLVKPYVPSELYHKIDDVFSVPANG